MQDRRRSNSDLAHRQDRPRERLEREGPAVLADAELVALVRACLSPAPDARPADASEVAGRIETYLHTVEERARRAEVKSAELRVKARSTLAIATVVVLAVVLGGGMWLSLANQRRERHVNRTPRGRPSHPVAGWDDGVSALSLWGASTSVGVFF